jgi:hypothetical protein
MTDTSLPAVTPADQMPGMINSTVLLNPDAYKQMMLVAEFMSKGVATVPEHLRNKPSDCLAIVMQSMVWGMLPHVVAQKSFLTPNGIIGYEAQLVHAVALKNGGLATAPAFEFFGDWSKVRGKMKWQEGEGQKKGYWRPDWQKSDEAGLGVRCKATLAGETEPRVIEFFLSQCQPRFSTQWATDPEQQICYVAVRKFVRRYCPGALLGVYAAEELEDIPPEQLDENTRRGREQPRKDDIKAEYPADRFTANLPKWRKSIEDGKTKAADVIAMISGEYALSESQKARIQAQTVDQSKGNAATGAQNNGGAQ